MHKRLNILVLASLMIGLLLAACGGSASDPTATVQELFKAVESKQFSRIADLACAAQKDEIVKAFDPSASLAGGGISAQEILDAMTFKLANMEYKETSRSGNNATVHVKGNVNIDVDAAKFKGVLRKLLEAQGVTGVDDAMLDQFMDPAMEQFKQLGQSFDEDMKLVNENGKWLICE